MDYKCSLCSFVCDWEDLCVEHMKKEHVRWRSEGGGGKNYNTNVDNYLLPDRSQRSSLCFCRTIRRIKFLKGRGKSKRNAGPSRGTTPYTNPQWMDNLRQHFFNLIVEKCSQVTRNSVSDNIDIQVCMLLF